MDIQNESTRKTSLAIIGARQIPFFPSFPLIQYPTAENIQGTDYFLLAPDLAQKELEEIFTSLTAVQVLETQIILIQEPEKNTGPAAGKKFSTFTLSAEESSEETRTRFHQFLEQQKHRILWEFWNSISKSAATGELIEKIHFTHSIALSLNLSVRDHWKSLKAALQLENTALGIWNPEHPLPLVAAEMADLVLKNLQNPSQLREELRIRSAQIPFRQRTEFRSAIEKCIELLWKGTNAA